MLFFEKIISNKASASNVAIVLVLPAPAGTTQEYDLGDYKLTCSLGQRIFRRAVIHRNATEQLTYHHQLLSQAAQAVNHAMQQMNGRVESVLGQKGGGGMRTKPSTCHVCAGDATYEAGVAVSVGKVVGMSEWIQQWQSLADTMQVLERKLRECVVAPPEELIGPRFTTCKRCAGSISNGEPDSADDDDDNTPLKPFLYDAP